MKKTALWILCVCMTVVCSAFGVSAVGYETVTLDVPDSAYQLYTPDKIVSENGMIYGMTETDFKSYLESHSILVYGSRKTGSLIFHVTTAPVSSKASDFRQMEEKDIRSVGADLTDHPAVVFDTGQEKFLAVNYVDNSGSTPFFVQQYITVCDGRLYVLTVNTPGENLSAVDAASAVELANALTLNRNETSMSIGTIFTYVLLVLLFLVILAVAVITVMSMIRFLLRRTDQENSEE